MALETLLYNIAMLAPDTVSTRPLVIDLVFSPNYGN